MILSHSECAKRYRLKKKLIARADNMFRTWQVGLMHKSTRTPREVQAALDDIIALPYGWNKNDYDNANNNLSFFQTNLFMEDNVDLQKDITSNQANPVVAKRSVKKMQNAYTAMVQILELAKEDPADEAAAVLEVARYVARKILKKGNVPKSDAVAFCLSLLPKSYIKPKWLENYMDKLVKKNCKNLEILYGEQ